MRFPFPKHVMYLNRTICPNFALYIRHRTKMRKSVSFHSKLKLRVAGSSGTTFDCIWREFVQICGLSPNPDKFGKTFQTRTAQKRFESLKQNLILFSAIPFLKPGYLANGKGVSIIFQNRNLYFVHVLDDMKNFRYYNNCVKMLYS